MRNIFRYLSIILLCIVFGCFGIAVAVNDWQPVRTPEWISAEIPPGWTILDELSMTDNNHTASFSARSPDWNSELVYIMEHTGKSMSMDLMEEYQDNWMDNRGFRICQTKDPVKRQKSGYTSLKQVFVQGTNKGAVMYSATYPDWGRYHVALLMTGQQAVQEYYDLIPALIPDHVKPI